MVSEGQPCGIPLNSELVFTKDVSLLMAVVFVRYSWYCIRICASIQGSKIFFLTFKVIFIIFLF